MSGLHTARWMVPLESETPWRRRTRTRPWREASGSALSKRPVGLDKYELLQRRLTSIGDRGTGTKRGSPPSCPGAKKPKREDDPGESSGQRRRRKDRSATMARHRLQVVAQRNKAASSATRMRISRMASSGSSEARPLRRRPYVPSPDRWVATGTRHTLLVGFLLVGRRSQVHQLMPSRAGPCFFLHDRDCKLGPSKKKLTANLVCFCLSGTP
jgi:hypothetical protein